MSRARDLANRTIASAALPKAGGAMTGAITTNSTFDGIDIATRDAVLTSTTTLATAAAPKASPAFTGTPTGITAAHITSGVLPVGVTGGSGLNAVAVTVASGEVIKVTSRANRTQTHQTVVYVWKASDCYHNITTTDGNYVLVTAVCPINFYVGSVSIDSGSVELQIWHSTTGVASPDSYARIEEIQYDSGQEAAKKHGYINHNGGVDSGVGLSANLPQSFSKSSTETMQFLHGPITGTAQYYKVYIKYAGHVGTGTAAIMNPDSNTWGSMTLSEIKA